MLPFSKSLLAAGVICATLGYSATAIVPEAKKAKAPTITGQAVQGSRRPVANMATMAPT
jgi:hypothetical protein